MASYYIYSIQKNGKGYIGLASGSAKFTDYGWRLKAPREKLDRMLQHLDNAYKIEGTYGAATETSVQLDAALKSGAYLCNFYYNDDTDFGIPSDKFDLFSSFWKSSQTNAKMNFAELVYIYVFRDDYALWNSMWGSQGNFTLKYNGFLKRYPSIAKNKYLTDMLKKTCDRKITWGAPSGSKEVSVLYNLFWPENLIASHLEKTLALELLTLADYRDAVSEAVNKAKAKKTKTGVEIQLDLPDIIKKKVAKKTKDIKGIIDDLNQMGFKVDVPSDDTIDKIIAKLSSVLSKDSTKDQKTIEIPNVISVKYETKRIGEPEWMPTKGEISVPNIDATETVKAHCVNRCYGLLQQKSETANETIEVINHYQQFLGDKAQKFVEAVQVIAAKQKNKGSLFAFEQHNPESRWVAFGRKPNTKDRLFYAPIEQKEAILDADAYWDASQLEVY